MFEDRGCVRGKKDVGVKVAVLEVKCVLWSTSGATVC